MPTSEQFTPAEVVKLWPWLEPALRPAIETGTKTSDQVLDDLAAGRMQCWMAAEGGDRGLIVTRVDKTTDTGNLALWIVYAAGKMHKDRPMAEKLAIMRALLEQFERRARVRGCIEMRVTPERSWASVLTDYERDGSDYRKVL